MVQFHFQDGWPWSQDLALSKLFLEAAVTRRAMSMAEGDSLQDRTLDYVELLVSSMSRAPYYTWCTPNSLIHPTKSPKPATGTHLLMDPKAMSLLCAGGRASHFSHNCVHY